MSRTIATATVEFAMDSLGDVPPAEYMTRLEAAIRALPDCTADTEVSVFGGTLSLLSRYEGLYSDSEPWQYDAMSERLHDLAEQVYQAMLAENA